MRRMSLPSTPSAPDLTRGVPRSPFDELDGFAWLPRMLDKARAFFAGTHGEYTAYPCPGDKTFLKHFGLDPTALGAVIKGGASDEEVARWVATHAKDPSDGAKAAFRRSLREAPPNPFFRLVIWVFRRKLASAIRAKSPHVDHARLRSFSHLVAAEEGHPLP